MNLAPESSALSARPERLVLAYPTRRVKYMIFLFTNVLGIILNHAVCDLIEITNIVHNIEEE